MRSFQTTDQTCVPCFGRRILNHWTTREVLPLSSLLTVLLSHLFPLCSLKTPCQSLCVCCFFCMKYLPPLPFASFWDFLFLIVHVSAEISTLWKGSPPPPLTPYLKLLFYYLFISLRKLATLCCYRGHLFICLLSLSSGFKRAEITLVMLWLCALCLEQCPRHDNLSTDIYWMDIYQWIMKPFSPSPDPLSLLSLESASKEADYMVLLPSI